MNCLNVTLIDGFYMYHSISKFSFTSDNITISFIPESEKLNVVLSSNRNCDAMEDKFYTVFDLLFIILGYFPPIESMFINNEIIDISILARRYQTSQQFAKSYSALCHIDSDTINNVTLSMFTNHVDSKTLSSFEYVSCTEYDHIVSEHKLVLLLHTIDGFIINSHIKNGENNMVYREKVKNIFLKFFSYNQTYNCEILQCLNVTEDKFISTICDTRNGLSHFDNKKEKLLSKGDAIMQYFYLTRFSLRAFILVELLHLTLLEENAKENLFVYHDWIAENKNPNTTQLKSNAYKLANSISKLNGFQ